MAPKLKYAICFLSVLHSFISLPQSTGLEAEWDHPVPKYDKTIVPVEFKKEDAVIINDEAVFNFTNYSEKTLKRNVLLKIMTQKGLNTFNHISLPESFDQAENKELWSQGRHASINIPFISTYNIEFMMARVIKPNGQVVELFPRKKVSQIKWITESGEYTFDNVTNFTFENLEVGDLLEFNYKANYKGSYGNDVLSLSSEISKVNANYSFRYIALSQFQYSQYILTDNIPDSCKTKEFEKKENTVTYIKETVKFSNLPRINYFIHAFTARQLPTVHFNMNYTIRLVNSNYYSIVNLPDYAWTNAYVQKDLRNWYTKMPNDIRKFIATFPAFENDTTDFKFVKALTDTLNGFRYLSANYLYYNDPPLYNLFTTEHLLKRRFAETNMLNIYEKIMDEKKVFCYITNVQDKRLGEHNPLIRNRAYENIILSIPYKRSYKFVVPRYNGLKYFFGELPFYYEGAIAALFPINYKKLPGDTMGNHFKFVKTFCGSENDNVRSENATIKIKTDSLFAQLNIKESLAGQFSTILRPLYLGDYIDSTIHPVYFRKCTTKPLSSRAKYILKNKSEDYPFRYNFDCSEKIQLTKPGLIDLNNWFSFVLNDTIITEKPTHDYYFDFKFTDLYNYVFEFDKPVNILNTSELDRSFENEHFSINTSFTEQETGYVLSIKVKIKSAVLPKEAGHQLLEFVEELTKVNHLQIRYSKKS